MYWYLFISFRYGPISDSHTFIQGWAPNGAGGILKLRKFLLFLQMNHIFADFPMLENSSNFEYASSMVEIDQW